LLKILDEWTDYLEGEGQIDAIYTDCAEAFGKVPHKRLIHKLKAYNINENLVQWIMELITNRQQKVKVNGTLSEWLWIGMNCWLEVLMIVGIILKKSY